MNKNYIRNKATHKVKSIHYFERYIRLVDLFGNKNKLLPEGSYTESHHILPKANDMFPEYEDFKKHPWNRIDLTARQHFIVHWILWKAFGGSQIYAFRCFIDQVDCKNNKRQDLKVTSKVYEELKLQAFSFLGEQRKHKATYVDGSGNKIYCRTDDPRVLSGELISSTKGRKYKPRTDDQKKKTKKSLLEHHRNKEKQPNVNFYRGVEKVTVIKHSDEYYRYVDSKEWSTKCTPERRSFVAAESNRKRSRVRS
jgi:hypothetical protein